MTDGHDGADRGAERRDRRRSAARAWSRSGRAPCSPTSTRSWRGSGWRWRTSATSTARRSPARSRPAPTAPARSCATSRPRSRGWSWSSPTAACAELSAATDPELLRAARVGVGALGAISAVTLRCVPAFTLDRVDTPRPREEVLDGFQAERRRQRPLRALHLPLRRQRPGPGAQPHRGAGPPARPGRRLPQRRRPGELGAGGALGHRQALPGGDPVALAAGRAPRLRQPHGRPQRPGLRQRPPRPLHRDGVRRSRASTGRRRRGG